MSSSRGSKVRAFRFLRILIPFGCGRPYWIEEKVKSFQAEEKESNFCLASLYRRKLG
jgi:hypothetical protein